MDNLVKDVAKRINAKITELKKQGIVGMSGRNLYAVSSTTGLTCGVKEYRSAFMVALGTIKRKGFEIIGEPLKWSDFEVYGS